MNVFTASNPIILGRQYENEIVIIQFPIRKWREAYGEGTFFLRNRRPGETEAYECVIEQNDDYVLWEITATELQYQGRGEAQLTYRIGDKVAKSEIFKTAVKESLPESEDAPEPFESYVERVETAAQTVSAAEASAAASAATATEQAGIATEKAGSAAASAEDALMSRNSAASAAGAAETAATTAGAAAASASGSAENASRDATTAENAKNDALSAKNEAVSAKTAAETAKAAAEAAAAELTRISDAQIDALFEEGE